MVILKKCLKWIPPNQPTKTTEIFPVEWIDLTPAQPPCNKDGDDDIEIFFKPFRIGESGKVFDI